jgi:glycosyltransferase involved in cell wall biosynthesis
MKILYFAPVDWNFLWQRPHHILTRLSSLYNYDIDYVQPLGVRNIQLSDIRRALSRFVTLFKRSYASSHNIKIKNLIFIPFVYSLARHINISMLKQQLKKNIDKDTIIWVTTPAHVIPDIISSLPYRSLIYEMMDDYQCFHPLRKKEIDVTEQWLMKNADLIITTSRALYEKAHEIDARQVIMNIPNGVDYEFFEQSLKSSKKSSSGNPTIGFIGALNERIDFEIIELMAERWKNYSFILVGPVKAKIFPQKENIHYVGTVEYSKVPYYCDSFDVCLIPFTPGEFADTINPIKLYEYFALGKPVVAYKMKELEPFNDLLYLAKDKEDFLLNVEKAIAENNPQLSERRKLIARQNDWSVRVKSIEDLIQCHIVRNTGHKS